MAFQLLLAIPPPDPPPRFQSLSAFAPPAPLLPVCQLLSYLTLPYTSSLQAAHSGPPMIPRLQGMPATHGLKTAGLGDLLALPPGIVVSQVIQIPL